MNHLLKCHDIVKTDFTHGDSCYLYDSQGKRYVDFESGIWCTILGHSHPDINKVMQAQIKNIIHLGTRYPNALAENAAMDVLDITGIGDEGKCIFLSSGSEAVEFGVQIVRRVSEKSLLLTFSNSYLAAYGSAGNKSNKEWRLFDWSMYEHKDQPDHLIDIPFDDLGGFIFEPGGSGSGFVKFPSKQLVKDIVQQVRQASGLVMANEVTTGMGRTGKWFGFQHYDIQPDIVSLGKGLGNGYPVSAVAVNHEIAEQIENSGFSYAQSHQNDPLGCSVAKEVISVMRSGNWIERGIEIGEYFLEGLKRLQEKYPVVKEARGRGVLLALEFHPHERISVEQVYRLLLEKGFLVGYYPVGNILRFDPPLTVEKKEIIDLLACLDSILETAR